ncbi:MAG: HAD-IIA family hydrolase [Acidimicrobiales bacterium]
MPDHGDPGRRVWVLDLDGVMWLGDTPIPGAAEATSQLIAAGHTVAFCTNNSSERVGFYTEKLTRFGVDPAAASNVVSSAMAAASLVEAGERVLLCAGEGAREAVEGAGAEVVDQRDWASADVVVVGFHRTFDYTAMSAAVRAVLGGARLVATNDDPIYPDADGPAPGCGSILASIERGSGVVAAVAGKPNGPMADVLIRRFGGHGVFVGDSLTTDGAMAAALGWPFGLVLTGNVGADSVPDDHDPQWLAADLATLVERHLR